MDVGPELLFEKDGRYFLGSDHKLVVIGKAAPKVRVKKYRYAYNREGIALLSNHMCEEIAKSFFNGSMIGNYTKLEWSMIEESDYAE
jgi:hypothetical protein